MEDASDGTCFPPGPCWPPPPVPGRVSCWLAARSSSPCSASCSPARVRRTPFDRAVDSPVISWFAARDGLALWLAYPGTMLPAAALSLVIAIACLITGRLRGAVLAVAAVPVAVGLCEVLIKPLVHRTYIGQVVYPSGHTAAIFALAATVTVLLLAPPRPAMPRWLRILILAVAYLTAGAVVIGVIAVRFHYFTDTVAGAAVGVGTVCGLALVLDLIPAVRPSRIPRRSAAT